MRCVVTGLLQVLLGRTEAEARQAHDGIVVLLLHASTKISPPPLSPRGPPKRKYLPAAGIQAEKGGGLDLVVLAVDLDGVHGVLGLVHGLLLGHGAVVALAVEVGLEVAADGLDRALGQVG